MSFEYLRSFLAVANHGSFFSAAVELGVSRTTLRRHVEGLEAATGVALLRRSRNGVEITEAGQRLVGGGLEMERDFSALLAAVSEFGRKPQGEVRILAQTGLPPAAVAPIYGVFRAAWRDLRIATRFSDEPLEENLANVDVLVWFGSRDPGPTWAVTKVVTMPVRLFATQPYLDEHGTPASVADLRTHELLAWVGPGETAPRIVTTRGHTVPVEPMFTSTNVDLLHELARWGHGMVWMPDGPVPPVPGWEPIIPVLEGVVGASVDAFVAAPKALSSVPKFRVVLDTLESMRAVVDQVTGAPPNPFIG